MSVSSSSLPAGFDALTPFVDFWAADTAAGRAHCRDVSDDVARLGFYNAMVGQVPDALAYLDAKPLSQFDEAEQRLMNLVLCFAHVALAVELQRDLEPQHALVRPYMRITKAPADRRCASA
ncbi:MAG TPA: hypothetical protein VIR56_12470 [Solimonas sp.]